MSILSDSTWNKVFDTLSTQPSDVFQTIGILTTAVNIFRDAKSADEAIDIINDAIAYSKTLRSRNEETLFMLEVFHNSLNNQVDLIYRGSPNTRLINKNAQFTAGILSDIFSKVNVPIDPYQIDKKLYEISELIENNNCSEQFPKYFNYYDHPWYRQTDFDVNLKRIFAVRVIKDNREFLLNAGFLLNVTPLYIVRETPIIRQERVYIALATFGLWTLIFFLFFYFGDVKGDWILWISAILLGIVITYFVVINHNFISSYSVELSERQDYTNRLFTIASISLGLSILFTNTFNKYTIFSPRQYIALILTGLLLLVIALLLPVFFQTAENVRLIITIQRSLLWIAIALVIYDIGLVFFRIK